MNNNAELLKQLEALEKEFIKEMPEEDRIIFEDTQKSFKDAFVTEEKEEK